jgi:hypothetical protein
MYLRRHDKKVDGEHYNYWSLVESVRTARGPRQRIVSTIGKLPGLDREERIGWKEIGRILDGSPISQKNLFEQPEEAPSWAAININKVSVERLRHFGDIYLNLLLWNKLGFAQFCKEHMSEGKEDIPWSIMASILVIARFCAPSSELQIAQSWYDKTALDDLLGVPTNKINDDRLYRTLDTASSSAPPSIFSSMTSPPPTSREAHRKIPRQKEATAGITALTVPRSVLVL